MSSRAFPHSLVLIFAMIVLAQVATLVLPAGEFQREGKIVIPGTYERVVEDSLVGEADWRDSGLGQVAWVLPASLLAVPKGLKEGGEVIFFVFLIGGVIAIIRRTGAMDAVIGAAIRRLGHRPLWLIAGDDGTLRRRLFDDRHGGGVHAVHPRSS